MALVWITGNSGSGKSTACEILREAGNIVFDADEDGFCEWFDRRTGRTVAEPPDPVPAGWLDSFGWRISRPKISKLRTRSTGELVLLFGSAENEADIRDLFDASICLVVDDLTMTRRLATRTNNAFGKHAEELRAALYWNPRMRPLYESLGAVIIDTAQPKRTVARAVLAAAKSATGAR